MCGGTVAAARALADHLDAGLASEDADVRSKAVYLVPQGWLPLLRDLQLTPASGAKAKTLPDEDGDAVAGAALEHLQRRQRGRHLQSVKGHDE